MAEWDKNVSSASGKSGEMRIFELTCLRLQPLDLTLSLLLSLQQSRQSVQHCSPFKVFDEQPWRFDPHVDVGDFRVKGNQTRVLKCRPP